MAYWQREFLRSGATWTNGGTLKLDLPKTGLLGSIMIHARRAQAQDAFATALKWRLIDYISKVEIIANGSEIIKSYTGEVAKALTFFDGGGGAPDQEQNYSAGTRRAHFMVNFGRRLFDRRFLLDLSKFSNVEINLTNDGTSSFFGGDWTVDILCYYLRDLPANVAQGYFRTEDWRSWTTVQNERKYLDLPTERKIRRIGLHVLPAFGTNNNADTQSYNVVDDIELYLKSRALKVMDYSLRELWYENYFHHGREMLAAIEPYHTGGYGVKVGLGQTLAKAIGQMPQGGTPGASTIALEPGNDGASQKLLRTGTDNYSMILLGLALENLGMIHFDQDPDDPGSWLDPAVDKVVNLDVHTADSASADNGTVRVILDRLISY
jgi:hypothetical protein